MTNSSGSLALVLHAHLPFVRHPEHEFFHEENWIFEAISESYVPLLQMMQRLLRRGVRFKLTLSVSPTLSTMLSDPLLRDRYIRHLDLLIALTERECERNCAEKNLLSLSEFYRGFFAEIRRTFIEQWDCDLLGVFRQLRGTGAVEIMASAATHAILPILQQSPEAAQAAFAREIQASRQVWSAQQGYPGDPAYRDFYRDIGFDLSARELAPLPGNSFTGIKYHRVTGRDVAKQIYDRAAAEETARRHAHHFVERCAAELQSLQADDSNPS